jgi:hypothetical protein
MSKIAFDLDGVFVPDCLNIPNVGGLTEFYALTYYMKPVFRPGGEWSIITARNAKYRAQTMAWVNDHFENKPVRVWHELIDQTPEEYKAEVINQNGIEFYIESDMNIVQYLMDNTQAQVIHFDMICRRNFTI